MTKKDPVIFYTVGIVNMLSSGKDIESENDGLILLYRNPKQLEFTWQLDDKQERPDANHEWLSHPAQVVDGLNMQTSDDFYAFIMFYLDSDKAQKAIAQYQLPTKLKKRFYIFTNKEIANQQRNELQQKQEQSFMTQIPMKVKPYVPKFRVVVVDLQRVLAEIGRKSVMPELIRDPEIKRRFFQNAAQFKDQQNAT